MVWVAFFPISYQKHKINNIPSVQKSWKMINKISETDGRKEESREMEIWTWEYYSFLTAEPLALHDFKELMGNAMTFKVSAQKD